MDPETESGASRRRSPITDSTGEAFDICPYSDETIVACRHYAAVSEHGDFPRAGDCRFAHHVRITEHVRQKLCRRGTPGTPTPHDQV